MKEADLYPAITLMLTHCIIASNAPGGTFNIETQPHLLLCKEDDEYKKKGMDPSTLSFFLPSSLAIQRSTPWT